MKCSNETLRRLLRVSNHPMNREVEITSRWRENTVSVFIAEPDPANTKHAEYRRLTIAAMQAINSRLRRKLLVETREERGSRIRVHFGCAYIPPGVVCDFERYSANVSCRLGGGEQLESDDQGEIRGWRAFLQVGHGRQPCIISKDVLIYEFGHALGLRRHFRGFGVSSSISSTFWNVLATLYANEVGTPFGDLKVRRVAFF